MSLFRRDSQQTAEKLVAKGKIEAAIKEYRKLLGRTGDDPTTLNRVGDLYVRLRKNEEAISFYTQTAQKYANDGFYVKAIAVYKKIQRIEPTQIEVHRRLAELYQRQGLKNDARNHYGQLAEHYLRNENTSAAIDVCRKMVELEPDNPSHHLKLADLHREAGNLSDALRSYGAIASLMLSHGQVDHAYQVYERAIGVDPADLAFGAEAVASLKKADAEDRASSLIDLIESQNPEGAGLRSLLSDAAVASEPDEESSSWEPPLDEAPELDDEGSTEEVESLQSEPAPALESEEAPELEGSRAVRDPVSGEWRFTPEPELEEPEFELELDLDFDNEELTLEEPADEAPEISEPAPMPEAADPPEEKPSREAELLSEADVFLKYGLVDKGLERLDEVLEISADHPLALQRLIPILIEREEVDRVVALSESLQRRSASLDEPDPWNAVQTALAGAGYRFENDRVLPPEAAAPTGEAEDVEDDAFELATDADIPAPEPPVEPPADLLAADDEGAIELDLDAEVDAGELLAELEDGEEEAPAAASETLAEAEPLLPDAEAELGPDASAAPDLDDSRPLEAELDLPPDLEPAAEVSPEPEPEPAVPEPEPEVAAAEAAKEEELTLDDAREQRLEEFAEATTGSTPQDVKESAALDVPAADAVDPAPALAELETSTEWLDNAPEASDKLFEDEAEFFDLAAALEGEIEEEAVEETTSGGELGGEEQSLDEIVEGFKRGVSENISEEDSDTHYNLGIAYREMMLLDEAIGEFQISARDDRYLADSCAMLGLCFRDKGLPDLAVKWYEKALAHEGLTDEQRLGMLYDLGTAYEDMGEPQSALQTFQSLSEHDGAYRDVAARITALEA